MADQNVLQYLSYFKKLQNEPLNTQDDWLMFFKKLRLLKEKAHLKKAQFKQEDILLQQLYLDILAEKIPTYQLSPESVQKALKRTKTLWKSLKNNPLFEEAIYQYRFGDIENKLESLHKIFYCLKMGIAPFFPSPQLEPVVFESNDQKADLVPNAYILSSNDTQVFINFDLLLNPSFSVRHLISTIYHEMSHLIQQKIIKDKNLNTDFFDKEYTRVLAGYYECYDPNSSLEKLLKKHKKKYPSISIRQDTMRKILTQNPLEQEAYLCEHLIGQLIYNQMVKKNLILGKYGPYPLDNFYPFENKKDLLAYFGEKEYSDRLKYFIPYDFFDRSPAYIDETNPFTYFNHAQKELDRFLKNPLKNEAHLTRFAKYMVACFDLADHTPLKSNTYFYDFIADTLKLPIFNNNHRLKSLLINQLKNPGKNLTYIKNPLFLNVVNHRKRILYVRSFKNDKEKQL